MFVTFLQTLTRAGRSLDAWLMGAASPARALLFALTTVVILATALPNIPRAYKDFSGTPVLHAYVVQPYANYGPDSLSDMYGARVVLNDPADMFVKARLDQTPLEAETWSKEASAPYPPVVLLAEAGLYALGEHTGIGFYGCILTLAALFVATSARYFWTTRWYLFPLLYLNCSYVAYRFVYVQDSTYLVMLTVVMAALYAARAGRDACHALVALAITMKLSPLYYATNVFAMSRRSATLFAAVLVVGLVMPYFIWDNYLYIYTFANELKGSAAETILALIVTVPFSLVLWYVQVKLGFDREMRVGWGLVPFALFLGLKMNVARHHLIVLLVPDKHGLRNVIAAVGLALPALFPSVIRLNSALPISTALLCAALVYFLDQIGWDVVRSDLRQPARTWRLLLGRVETSASDRR